METTTGTKGLACGDEWHTSARAGQDICNDLFNDNDDGTLLRCDRALNHPGPCLAGDPLCLTRCPQCGGNARGAGPGPEHVEGSR